MEGTEGGPQLPEGGLHFKTDGLCTCSQKDDIPVDTCPRYIILSGSGRPPSALRRTAALPLSRRPAPNKQKNPWEPLHSPQSPLAFRATI